MKLTAAECRLRKRLLGLVEQLPSSPRTLSKIQIRGLHSGKRLSVMATMNGSFDYHLRLLREHLAHPQEIAVSEINPSLSIVVGNTQDSQLFNAASLLWSVPVSKGFGRRIRYLVRDKNNGKLIGIIGLTDPVFNLTPRDAWVGWNSSDRAERLIHVMDAFVLGALPPYSKILGGKLVALLATSKEVVTNFHQKYRTYEGIISKSKKDPRLVLLTTSSALGRSSLYNRLRIPGSVTFLTDVETDRVPTWYTQGYGHFHIPEDMFAELQRVLIRRNHPYAKGNRFGNGPNWRIRVIRQAAVELGIDTEVIQHGIRRQVYVIPLANNAREILLGTRKRPSYITRTAAEIADYWRERWAIPRAQRHPEWRNWNVGGTISSLRRLHVIAERMG